MAANEIHVGDVGTVFNVTILDSGTAFNIAAFTTRLFYLKQAGGSVTTISAVIPSGSGTSGVLSFTSTATHFDQSGRYQLQAYLTDGSTTKRSEIYEFTVYPNLA